MAPVIQTCPFRIPGLTLILGLVASSFLGLPALAASYPLFAQDLGEVAFRQSLLDLETDLRLMCVAERMGFQITDVACGAAGLAIAASGDFDLVLIDLDLPDMDGAAVAAQICKQTEPPLLVALTAHLIQDTESERARLHVARILFKPISPRALAEALTLSAPAPTPPANAAVLASLSGDVADLGRDITAQILREFLADLPSALETIHSAPAARRRKAAHRLKGAASNFQLNALCAVLADVEAHPAEMTADLHRIVRDTADAAVRTLQDVAAQMGLQTDAGSTKRYP